WVALAPGALPARKCRVCAHLSEFNKLPLVEHADTGLVTLTGVGGSGKTRVAIAAGAALLDHFRDGVWLVELSPVSDPAMLANTVLVSLGIAEQPGRTAYDQLVR